MPLEKFEHALNIFSVSILCDISLARRGALADMIIKTRSVLPYILRQFFRACPDVIELSEKLYNISDCSRIRIRSEISRGILFHASGDHYAGKVLACRHLDIRITLVIFQHRVIFRPVFLDKIGFEDQGLKFTRCDYILKALNILHHAHDLRALLIACLKILAHAVLKAHGLSDIDYVVVRVMHDIDPGAPGQLFQFFLYIKIFVLAHFQPTFPVFLSEISRL